MLLIQVYYLNNWPPSCRFEVSPNLYFESYLDVYAVALEIPLQGVRKSLINYMANFLRLYCSSEATQMRINNNFPKALLQTAIQRLRRWKGSPAVLMWHTHWTLSLQGFFSEKKIDFLLFVFQKDYIVPSYRSFYCILFYLFIFYFYFYFFNFIYE